MSEIADPSKVTSYFTDELGLPLEERKFEYRVCDFCSSPPCEDCLPWDYSTFKLSEIPIFFPDATVLPDGGLDVHKHPNCRCTLTPVTGEGVFPMETENLDGDIKEKLQAIRNHKLAFNREDHDALLARLISQPVTPSASPAELAPAAVSEYTEHMGEPGNWGPLYEEMLRIQARLEANAQTVASMKANDAFGAVGKGRQMQLSFSPEGTIKLTPQVQQEIKKQVEGKLNPRVLRALYAFRSPMGAARAVTRESMQYMGEMEGTGAAAGMASAVTPLAFFMVLPTIEKLIKYYFDLYLLQQQAKQLTQFDRARTQAYRDVYRGIVPA